MPSGQNVADVQDHPTEHVARRVVGVVGDVEEIVGGGGGIGRVTALVDVVVVGLEQDLQRCGGGPQQAEAGAVGLEPPRISGVGASDGVEAVAVFAIGRDPQGQGVADRDVDRALQPAVVVIAILALDIAVIACEAGVHLVDEHRAAGGVLTGEGALRAPQHLHVRDVVIGLGLEVAGEAGDAVAIGDHPDRHRAGAVGLADAADVEKVALAEVLHRQVRRHELQLVDGGHSLLQEVGAGEHGRRKRRALQVDRPPLRRDDHFLRRGIGCGAGSRRRLGRRSGLGRLGAGRTAPGEGQHRRRQPQMLCFHRFPLPNIGLRSSAR